MTNIGQTDLALSKTLVIIPTYNAEQFIRRSIQSVLNQTKKAELWVVDNCSTDNTQTIVREYCEKTPSIKLIVNSKNLGRIGNWNRALDLFEASNFEFLKFLFMGDELLPNCLETIDQIATENTDIVAMVWPYFFRDLNGKETLSAEQLQANQCLDKYELVKLGLFPGELLGAIIAVAISKKGVIGNRFDDHMIGIVPFYDRLVTRGNSYFFATPLSRFHLDSHRTFFSSLNYHLVLESGFARAMALEQNKSWIDVKYYESIRRDIAKRTILNLANHYTFSFLIGLAIRLKIRAVYVGLKKIVKKWK